MYGFFDREIVTKCKFLKANRYDIQNTGKKQSLHE